MPVLTRKNPKASKSTQAANTAQDPHAAVAIRMKSGSYGSQRANAGDRVDVYVKGTKGHQKFSGIVVFRVGTEAEEELTIQTKDGKLRKVQRYSPRVKVILHRSFGTLAKSKYPLRGYSAHPIRQRVRVLNAR